MTTTKHSTSYTTPAPIAAKSVTNMQSQAGASTPVALHAANDPASQDAPQPGATRAEIFDRLSTMFRRAGTDVATQALFRTIVEFRVESLEKDK